MDLKSLRRYKVSGSYKKKVKNRYTQALSSIQANVNTGQAGPENLAHGSVQNICFVPQQGCSKFSFSLARNKDEEYERESTSVESPPTSECSDEESNKDEQLCSDIRKWCVTYNIPHQAVKSLIEIINKRIPNVLSKDPRTLLKTDVKINIKSIPGGSYWHNSLTETLHTLLGIIENVPNNISLNINIDGLPLYHSSKQQIWPILGNIYELSQLPPFVIGIYYGHGKPTDLESFLREFVDEMKHLIENNITIKDMNDTEKTVGVQIRLFTCDSPARAMIKGVCNYNAKDGCLKCTTRGEYSHVSGTVYFPRTGCAKRNDTDFRAKCYGQHHKMDSPLLELPVDMVEDFIVGDSLHLLDLGLMKRLLKGWIEGKFVNKKTKWCAQDIVTVSNFLSNCKLVKEVHRSVRSLNELAHWKGSEFRVFLYYLSFIILQKVLNTEAYHHFLCLFCAVTICSNKEYFHFLDLADSLLISFLEIFKNIYGKDYITSNVHNLTHLTEEVRKFGPLQDFSTYPFENKLYTLKRMIRHGNKPLAQIARRLSEKDMTDLKGIIQNKMTKTYPFLKIQTTKTGTNRNVLHLEAFILSSQKQDCFFLTHDISIIEITSIIDDEGSIVIKGNRIENLNDVFNIPIKSSYLNIYKCDCNSILKQKVNCKVDSIKCKIVCITYDSMMYFVPLLHTLR
ncbi:hypothetical protein HF086_011492 [Spodoptera exigua]|uniref:Transposase domain-containing protein n=1 Tax=Spodoptera exigua TaxID=7107 RepID=A0A922M4W7_SPOEX|nr:hypothetical protein HF086_011492 [Spodoptera exigua]